MIRVQRSHLIVLFSISIILSSLTYSRNLIWKDEITLWEDVVRKSPNKARGYNNLGNAFLEINEVKTALINFNNALSLKPNYADAHFSIAIAYSKIGYLDNAIKHFNIYIMLKPNDSIGYNELGVVYARKGFFKEAIKCFEEALYLDPFNEMAKLNLQKAITKKQQGYN